MLNVAAAVGYLYVASELWWIEPELKDVPGASGGTAFAWFSISLPVAAFVLTLHAVAAVKAWEKKQPPWVAILATTMLCWIGPVIIDFRHHGM